MEISRWKIKYAELGEIYSDQRIQSALEDASILEVAHVWEDPILREMAIGLRAAHNLITEDQQLGVVASMGANLAADRMVSPPASMGQDDLTSTVYGQRLDRLRRSLPLTGIGGL